MIWHKNKQADQWTRTEHPGINSHVYEYLIFDSEDKIIQLEKGIIFNKWCWHNWMLSCRRMEIGPYLWPWTKLKSKWIKGLNINPITLNLIEEKVRSGLECLGTGDTFLSRIQVVQTLRSSINTWDLVKLESFCKATGTVNKTKWQPTEWEKSFTSPTSDKGLMSKIQRTQETRHQNTK